MFLLPLFLRLLVTIPNQWWILPEDTVPPQPPQLNFSNTAVAPAPVRTFDPQTPHVLKNVELYQQPTLGSQLYNTNNNPPYQPTPTNPPYQPTPPAPSQMNLGHGHNVPPQVLAPTSNPMGFMPIPSPASAHPLAVTSSSPFLMIIIF